MKATGRIAWTLSFITVLLALSCDDENPTRPARPAATFENIWPHADSTRWTYALTQRSWPGASIRIYQHREDVPSAPTLDQVIRLIQSPPGGDSATFDHGTYGLRFEGEITTVSGVRAQNLVESLSAPGLSRPGTDVAPLPVRSLIDHLWTVRPDLRGKLLALGYAGLVGRSAGDGRQLDVLWLYLHGGAWTQTRECIGNYGDIDTLISWKYLERDISVSHSFDHQLVPGLADDIWLHAKILPRRTIRTGMGTFAGCVECVYLVDYGISTMTDENGIEIGFFHSYDYATIGYAANVGPVHSYQWSGGVEGVEGQERTFDVTLSLKNTNADNP